MLIQRLRRVVVVTAVAALFAGLTPGGAAVAAPVGPAAAPAPPVAPLAAASAAEVSRYPTFAPKTARAGGTTDLTYQLMASYAEAHPDPEVREAAAAALAQGDAAVAAFLALGGGFSQAVKRAEQRRVKADKALTAEITALRGTGGREFNAEVERVLAASATPRDRMAFKAYGARIARERDAEVAKRQAARAVELRARVQLIADSTDEVDSPNVHAAAVEALAGGDADILAFLESGLAEAGEADEQARDDLIAAREAELKAIEDAAELAERSRKANEARVQLIQAHGAGLRALQNAANSMASAAVHGRRAAKLLASKGSLKELEDVKAFAAVNLTHAKSFSVEAQNAALKAETAADVLVNQAKLPYGAQWAELAQGMALSAEAAHQATQTAVHAIDATIATHKAIGHATEAQRRAEQAERWKQQAIKHRDAAEKLAAVAKKQADAAELAADRAEAHRKATEAKTAEAWEHAAKTAEHRKEAQRQADIAADQREIAAAELQNAQTHNATAKAQAAEASRKRGLAKIDEDNARSERTRAEGAESKAETARDNAATRSETARVLRNAAFDAAEVRDLAEAHRKAAEAAVTAGLTGKDREEAEAAAKEARVAANKAQADADSAKRNADDATAAAAKADAAAIETERAAARAREAAIKADAAAAASRRAASAAEAEAAKTHQAAVAAQKQAAAATAQQVKAARAAEAADRAARGAATQALKSKWAAERSNTEARAATNEAASATTQSENAYRSAAAARSSAAAALAPASDAIELLAPFTNTDVAADFATQVAELAIKISEELVKAADARAVEANAAAKRAQDAAAEAHKDAKDAYLAAAKAAEYAAAAAKDNARAKRASLRAKEQARLARESAASAHQADLQAKRDARDARAAANQATEDARIAGLSAAEADRLSNEARKAADQAQKDADAAQTSARKAQEDADAADRSAKRAEEYAKEAATYAEKANQHADEAEAEVARLEREIRASETADLNAAFELTPAMLADAKDYLTAEQFASVEPFIAAARGDVSQFLTEHGPQLIGEFFRVDDIKACFSGKVLSCLIVVAEQLGPVRAFRALKLLYNATKAVKSFWDAVKKARKIVRNVTKKLDDCQKGLIKDLGGDLIGEVAGAAAVSARMSSAGAAATGPKKKCKVELPHSCGDDDDSFAATTPVLTPGGTRKPIRDVHGYTDAQTRRNHIVTDNYKYYVRAGKNSVSVPNCAVFFRAMSEREFKQLGDNGEITVRGTENFVTESRSYLEGLRDRFARRGGRNAEKYAVLVRYEMQPGTRDALVAAGKLPNDIGQDLNAVHLKTERGFQTFGLRPGSVVIFNSRIVDFRRMGDW